MTIEARKYQLIEKVMQSNEEELARIESILSEELVLSKSIDIALGQIVSGDVTPHAQVRKKYEKWL